MLVRLSGLVGKMETKQERGRKKETGGTEGAESRKLLLSEYSPRSESVGRRGWADMELPTLPVLPCRDRTCLKTQFSLKSLMFFLALRVCYILGTSRRQMEWPYVDCIAWTGNCVMVSEPNTRPTAMLPGLTHCIPRPQWRCITLLIELHLKNMYKKEKWNKVSLMTYWLLCPSVCLT